MKHSGTTWLVIILCWVLFPPLGIYLSIRKISGKRSASVGRGIAPIMGGFLFALMAWSLLTLETDDSFAMGLGVVFLASGIYLFCFGLFTRRRRKLFRAYINLVVNEDVRQLDTLAAQLNLPLEKCRKDIEAMIRNGFFHGYIEEGTRTLMLEHPHAQQASKPASNAYAATKMQAEAVRCKSCGANNFIMENSWECEYCGSSLGVS